MRELVLRVDKSGAVTGSGAAGHAAEHNAVKIRAVLTEPDSEVQYYRMFFEKSDGTTSLSPSLIPVSGEVAYLLPQSLTSDTDSVLWQLCGYRLSGDDIMLLTKSDTVPLSLLGSIDASAELSDDFTSHMEASLSQLDSFAGTFGLDIGDVSVSSSGTADAEITHNGYNYVLSLTVPKGETGAKGDTGATGQAGQNGQDAVFFEGFPDSISVCCNATGAPRVSAQYFPGHLIKGEQTVDSQAVVSAAVSASAAVVVSALYSSGVIMLSVLPVSEVSPGHTPDSITLSAVYGGITHTKKITVHYIFDGAAGEKGDTGATGATGAQGERGYSGLVPAVTASWGSAFTAAANQKTTVTVTGDMWIILGDGVTGYDNEWDVVLIMGDTAHTVTLPSVLWGYGAAPDFAASTTTEIRLYYIGSTLCGEWQVV